MPRKRITSVVTRGGDKGQTSLADGSRVSKSDPRIHTIGAVDELNSFTGALIAELADDSPYREMLGRLQQELFDLGAHLATLAATPAPDHEWLEGAVSALNSNLPPLTEFVIPGGTRQAAAAHICRTVCRRAERHCWEVTDAEQPARYLNRLSDLLFVLARVLNSGVEPQWRGLL